MKSLFLIIGAPGSGKTTDAQMIAKQDENITHFSTGDLLRTEASSESELGKIIKRCIDAGELVPVKVALGTITKAINSSICDTILIDGYPRSYEQMMELDTVLQNEKNIILKSVIKVQVSQEIAMDRVLGRNRGKDDTKEIFKNRMEVYNKSLKKIEDFYSSKEILYKTCGERELEVVVQEMRKHIEQLTHFL